jgi:hypothetical protein
VRRGGEEAAAAGIATATAAGGSQRPTLALLGGELDAAVLGWGTRRAGGGAKAWVMKLWNWSCVLSGKGAQKALCRV